MIGEGNTLQLEDISRLVSDTVAGYIVHKTEHLYKDCCQRKLTKREPSNEYIGKLSHGRLKNRSMPFTAVVYQVLAVLDASSPALRKSKTPAREAGMEILAKYEITSFTICEKHTDDFSNRLMKVVCNCFFNSQRKRSNDSDVKDRVSELKRVHCGDSLPEEGVEIFFFSSFTE